LPSFDIVDRMKISNRLIIGISGASGAVLGVRMLQTLNPLDVEVHLVMSKAAELTLAYETDYSRDQVRKLANVVHPINDIGAALASGSFLTRGMIVIPCSIRTMSELATGVTSTLLTRAADVILKERRKLVLVVRETPLHALHLHNMARLADAGAIIAPPVLGFYNRPQTIDDMVDQTVGRALDQFDIDVGLVKRWREEPTPKKGVKKPRVIRRGN